MRSSVDLPQPEGPSSTTKEPSSIFEVDAVDDFEVAVVLLDVLDRYRCHVCVPVLLFVAGEEIVEEAGIVGEVEEGPAIADVAGEFHGIAPDLAVKAELGRGGGAAGGGDGRLHLRGVHQHGAELLAQLRPQVRELAVEGFRTSAVEGLLLRLRIAHAADVLAVAGDEFASPRCGSP